MNKRSHDTECAKPVSQSQGEQAIGRPSRRQFLTGGVTTGVAAAALTLSGITDAAKADTVTGPTGGDDWWPSIWGPEDQAGASNLMSPEKVLEATSLIKDGQVFSLGRPYEPGMPFFPGRGFSLRIPGNPTLGPVGENKLIAHEEFLCTEIGQVGTQFDGLAHIGVELGGPHDNSEKRFYNGMSLTDIRGSYGFKKLGVEHVKPFVTPCVLFDIKALKGRDLERGEEIGAVDLELALEKQGLDADVFGQGDVALIRTGWGRQWMIDNKSYYDGEPGLGLEATQWLIDRGASLIGADNWAVEVLPSPVEGLAYPVHQQALTKYGVYLFENLIFDALSEAGACRAAFFFSPLPIKGATGSPGNPIAIT